MSRNAFLFERPLQAYGDTPDRLLCTAFMTRFWLVWRVIGLSHRIFFAAKLQKFSMSFVNRGVQYYPTSHICPSVRGSEPSIIPEQTVGVSTARKMDCHGGIKGVDSHVIVISRFGVHRSSIVLVIYFDFSLS